MGKYFRLALIVPFLLSLSYAGECAFPGFSENSGYFGDDSGTGSYLGVDINDIDAERVSALKLKDEHGVEVTMVDQDAPAGKAGVKEHDVILTMNGTTIDSGAQLRRMIRETPPGRTVAFGISRDGQPQTIKVQLADRHKTAAWGPKAKDFKFDMPDMPNMSDFDFPVSVTVVHSGMRSGLMIENITPQLGDFFGVKDGKGVLIRSVEKGSHAERAGFRAGDVIVRVNNQPVHDTSDFSHALRSHGKGTVTVGIIREKKEQTLTLPLPERKDTGDYLEESIDSSDLNAQVQRELSSARQQIAQLEPQLQYAIQESRQALERVRPEIEKAQRTAREEIERERPQIERALREAQHEMCTQQRTMHEQAHKMQQEWQKQHREIMKQNRKMMERLRHEMKGDWLQI